MGLVWEAALEGTKVRKLEALCSKNNVDSSRILRILRRESSKAKGYTWKIDESKGGTFKLYNVSHMEAGKNPKPSAKKPKKPVVVPKTKGKSKADRKAAKLKKKPAAKKVAKKKKK